MNGEKTIGAWRVEIEQDPAIKKLLENGVGRLLGPILDEVFPRDSQEVIPRMRPNGNDVDNLRKRIFELAQKIYPQGGDEGQWELQCYVCQRVALILGDQHARDIFSIDE